MQFINPISKQIIGRLELPEQGFVPPGVALLATRKMWSSTRGQGTIVAIIDTGVDYRHPDLAPNMIGGVSMVGGSKDFMDDNGHGTHVAGTIGANGRILGVAPDCQMLAVKVLNADGSGTIGDINRGIAWARNWKGPKGEQVDIINMSLGGPLPNPTMHAEIVKAVNQGITVVCAAGNSGDGNPNTDEVSYPAYYAETVAVGAIDLATGIANFSNSNNSINVVAPGVETYSTYPDNRYIKLSGTSMASPHIAGAVALIYSRWKRRFESSPEAPTVRNIIDYQAIDLGAAGFDQLYGYGLFSFDPAGGKSIRIEVGERRYLVNNKEAFFIEAPFIHGKLACADIREICALLSTDNRPVIGHDGKETGVLEIWS